MIERLAWDSGLFGYEVGIARVEQDLDINLFHKEAQQFKLVYIYCKDYLSKVSDNIQHIGTKVTFQKKIAGKDKKMQFPYYAEGAKEGREGIYECRDFQTNESQGSKINSPFADVLTKLALTSGEYSHFKLDERLKKNEFEELYSQWIQNAVAGNDRVLVYVKEERIEGLITLTLTNKNGKIGLLAVSEEFRGIGMGTQLLKAAFVLTGQAKIPLLEVVTQKVNLPAMALYQRNGFRISEEMEVYHYTGF